MSKKRRQSYLTQIKREKARELFTGDYVSFLRSCKMKMDIFVPKDERHVNRCLELIQRSNQLNLSSMRYSSAEFSKLLSSAGILCLSIQCEDRFGSYGIVGFISVDENSDPPTVLDFVISCRIAQKGVEKALFKWIAQREANKGRDALHVKLIRTKRNGPLVRVLEELPFHVLESVDQHVRMELSLHADFISYDIVSITSDVPSS